MVACPEGALEAVMEMLVAGLGPLDSGPLIDPGWSPRPWGSLVGGLEPWGRLLALQGDPGPWGEPWCWSRLRTWRWGAGTAAHPWLLVVTG